MSRKKLSKFIAKRSCDASIFTPIQPPSRIAFNRSCLRSTETVSLVTLVMTCGLLALAAFTAIAIGRHWRSHRCLNRFPDFLGHAHGEFNQYGLLFRDGKRQHWCGPTILAMSTISKNAFACCYPVAPIATSRSRSVCFRLAASTIRRSPMQYGTRRPPAGRIPNFIPSQTYRNVSPKCQMGRLASMVIARPKFRRDHLR